MGVLSLDVLRAFVFSQRSSDVLSLFEAIPSLQLRRNTLSFAMAIKGCPTAGADAQRMRHIAAEMPSEMAHALCNALITAHIEHTLSLFAELDAHYGSDVRTFSHSKRGAASEILRADSASPQRSATSPIPRWRCRLR